MELNLFILVIFLLGFIFISSKIEQKSIVYFLCILLIFLILKKYLDRQNNKNNQAINKENFQSSQEIEAISKMDLAVERTANDDEMKDRVGSLETNIEDLKKIIRAQNLNKQMERGEDAKTFSMTESQKRQDSNLESLEKEVDILLKLYKQESDNNDKDKYKTLPIYSSCKVRDQGKQYVRGKDNRTTQDLLRDLERTETLKNLGLNSETAENLHVLLDEGNNQNVDVNFNLV
jgi:TolA-binding protein